MASSEVRAPSLQVLINGSQVAGAISAQVNSTNHFAADRFRVRFSLNASGATVWQQSALQAEVRFGLDGAWASLITGDVDRVAIDVISGEVQLDGRDLAARLMSARTQETFENRTSSDIAVTLAGRHGLAANVVPTFTLVGRYYRNDRARTTLDQHARTTTEWDLLIWLAATEGFEVWVAGQTLNFAPSAAITPIVVQPTDCISMQLDRAMDFEGGLEVVVKSWDSRSQALVEQTATSPGGLTIQPARYVIVRPNLQSADAQSLAQRTLAQMLSHARNVAVEMPGDLTTMPRGTLMLSGTGTDFDNTYVIAEVERRISFRGGFMQTVEARLPAWTIS